MGKRFLYKNTAYLLSGIPRYNEIDWCRDLKRAAIRHTYFPHLVKQKLRGRVGCFPVTTPTTQLPQMSSCTGIGRSHHVKM
jgi:hypothetical protein